METQKTYEIVDSVGIDGVGNVAPSSVIEEVHGNGCPNKGDESFGNHTAIEDCAAGLLTSQATCHQWALCGMEAADSSAGYGEEKTREERIALEIAGCS